MIYAVKLYTTYECTDEGEEVQTGGFWDCLTFAFEKGDALLSPINGRNYAVERKETGERLVQFWPCAYWRDAEAMTVDELVAFFDFMFDHCDGLEDKQTLTAIVAKLGFNLLDYVNFAARMFDSAEFVGDVNRVLKRRGIVPRLELDFGQERVRDGNNQVHDS